MLKRKEALYNQKSNYLVSIFLQSHLVSKQFNIILK